MLTKVLRNSYNSYKNKEKKVNNKGNIKIPITDNDSKNCKT